MLQQALGTGNLGAYGGLGGISGVTGVAGATGAHAASAAGMPGMSSMTGTAGMQGTTALSGMSGVPGVPSMPGMAGMGGIPRMQGLGGYSTAQGVHGYQAGYRSGMQSGYQSCNSAADPAAGLGGCQQAYPQQAGTAQPTPEENPEKRALVEKVKKLQRTSEQYKAQWYTFCHMQNTWNYDPNRHNEQSLQKFLNMLNTTELLNGPDKDMGEGESASSLAQQVKRVQRCGFKESWYAYCMWFKMSMDYDPEHHDAEFLKCFLNCIVAASLPQEQDRADIPSDSKMELVHRIKDIQKSGFREHWCAYCQMFKWSKDYDPSRHQERFLQKFIESCDIAAPIFGIDVSLGPLADDVWDESCISEKIFVGGLPKATEPDAVFNHFSDYGAVKDVSLKYDESGQFRGFGFITFVSVDAAKAALISDEACIYQGKRINCQPAAGKGQGKAQGKGKGPCKGKDGWSSDWDGGWEDGSGWDGDSGWDGGWCSGWDGWDMDPSMMGGPMGPMGGPMYLMGPMGMMGMMGDGMCKGKGKGKCPFGMTGCGKGGFGPMCGGMCARRMSPY